MSSGAVGQDPMLPRLPMEHDVRRADYYAWELSTHKDAPKARPYWTLIDRNNALKAMKGWVRAQRK